ncbi:MAG: 1-(5-phosphoribosyl)-5-((5-phosphoribosylamino)methylideneamino)imidazole-4-carboxamide isomerase [Candidatus Rokubacteria bacterium]|nr:1-(5-phosphoribosyl)-5-((5-phosphoribosylamino)methylideneamino)imidazole-4-carboxamide isomerase [Candidatus Rokubacteria bacterium]
MLVIPAVDVRGGRAVRLREGRADAETVFAHDPIAAALRWAGAGCERLHVVDLDGAFGQARQTAVIADIIRAVAPIAVEVGGGLRDVAAIESVLAAGARWAVVGTRAALDPAFLRDAGRAFGERLIVAVDARGSRVAVKGWTEVIEETVADVGRRARDAGAAELLYTDVSRDGMETGPNVEDTAALARAVEMPILASGGVATVADLVRLAAIDGVRGTVVGRALYTGAIDLRAALSAVRSAVGARGSSDSSAGSAGATPNVRTVGGVGGSGARSPRP